MLFPFAWMRITGPIVTSVAGVRSVIAFGYDFQTLTRPPVVGSVSPLTGPTEGGTIITIEGSLFASDATVVLVERISSGVVTGVRRECEWRGQELLTQGLFCSESAIRCAASPACTEANVCCYAHRHCLEY